LAEHRNPNQQGGQDTRSLMIFALLFVVLFIGLNYLRGKKPAEPVGAPTPAQRSALPQTPPPQPQVAAPAAVAAAQAQTQPVAASAEQTTVVENDLYRIVFTNRGAQVKSWILKKYKDDAGKPLDLVQTKASQLAGLPLSVFTYDPTLRKQLDQALFVPSATETQSVPTTLTFVYSGNGITAHKTFHFDNSYVLHADVAVTQNGVPVEAKLAWPSGFGDANEVKHFQSLQLDYSQNGKAVHTAPKHVSGGGTMNGEFDWVGTSDSYFAAIFLPDSPDQASVVTLNNEVQVPRDAKDPSKTAPVSIIGAAVGSTDGRGTRVYVGPKSIDVLKTVHATTTEGTLTGPSLEPIIDFGFWGFIAKPLFFALRWVQQHIVSNWGWAIVILTVLLNILLLPTRITMMRSALKMQRIQPQIKAIQERYKKYKMNDPQKLEMNKEVQALYKEHNVNPFGGCLPTLLQLPILIAFYGMLAHTTELRQAHFLWLPDLSAPDPLHILPILFVIAMVASQRLTPTPGMDPAQQKMMTFTMPIMYAFFFWNYASGLALYAFTGALIGVLQQVVLNRTELGKEMRAIAAKRAARKQTKTGGKVIQARR